MTANNRNLAAAIANDYQIFDNQQTLTLKNVNVDNTVIATHAVAGCTSSKLTRSQIEMYGNSLGVENTYRNFSLPIVNCGGLEPRQGDKLAEASPSTIIWRVMNAEKRTLNTRWFCMCIQEIPL